MALRYRKSIKLGKGVKLNIGKKSAGISLGGKYGGMSFNTRNGARVRASAPGTGLSYTEKVRTDMGKKKRFKDFEDFAAANGEVFADEIAADETVSDEAPKKKKRIGLKIFIGLVLLVGLVEACGGNEEAPAVTPSPTEKIVQSAEPEKSPAPTQEVEETAKPEKTEEPEQTQKPENTPAPKSTAKPKKDTPAVIPDDDDEEEKMVWIPTNGGSKYHSKASCSNMDDPACVSINEAKSMGFTPCKRCYG